MRKFFAAVMMFTALCAAGTHDLWNKLMFGTFTAVIFIALVAARRAEEAEEENA